MVKLPSDATAKEDAQRKSGLAEGKQAERQAGIAGIGKGQRRNETAHRQFQQAQGYRAHRHEDGQRQGRRQSHRSDHVAINLGIQQGVDHQTGRADIRRQQADGLDLERTPALRPQESGAGQHEQRRDNREDFSKYGK